MNKNQLIDSINAQMQRRGEDGKSISKQQIENIVNEFVVAVSNALKKGEMVRLVNFGTFSKTKRKARKGRNPSTGREITIAERFVIKFSAGKGLKDEINR